jgi:uncharacterized delta-60 repeat protein
MKMKKYYTLFQFSIIFIAFLICFQCSLFAQRGTIDSSFGINGKVILSLYGSTAQQYTSNSAYSIGLQSNGKIVIAVYQNPNTDSFVVVRFTVNGVVDSSFGNNGVARILINHSSRTSCLFIQPDDKILVGGNTDQSTNMALARLTPNGSIDSSFGSNGKQVISFTEIYQLEYLSGIAMQSDGKIVIAGYFYNPNNKTSATLARFKLNGALDSSFGVNGKVIQNIFPTGSVYANGLAILPNDKILITGSADSSNNQFTLLMRYTRNGLPDSSFGKNGFTLTNADNFHHGVDADLYASSGSDIAIQADNRIITSGYAWTPDGVQGFALMDFSTIRYLPNGIVDSSFGINGIARSTQTNQDVHFATSVKIMPDKKIVAAGYGGRNAFKRDFAIINYKSNGAPDKSFGKKGIVRTDLGAYEEVAKGMAVQNDNKIILAGYTKDISGFNRYNIALIRYNYDPVAAISSGNSNEKIITPSVKFYPNPAKDVLHIEGIPANAKLTVTDNSGKTIKQIVSSGTVYNYNIAGLSGGVYYISITSNSKTETIKFIKQ